MQQRPAGFPLERFYKPYTKKKSITNNNDTNGFRNIMNYFNDLLPCINLAVTIVLLGRAIKIESYMQEIFILKNQLRELKKKENTLSEIS
jgi:hypothetical protein